MSLRVFTRFWAARRAIAAVEFAIILPVLLLLFIGTVEVLTLYRTDGKLNVLAFSVAQMVSVEPASVTATGTATTSLQDICNGAILGLAPFPPTGLTLDIGSVTMEDSPNGLPHSSKVYNVNGLTHFDVWEETFYVPAGATTCSSGTTGVTPLGASALESLATTSPPVTTATSFTGTTGEVEVPCDNAVIVKATMTYPGLTGLLLLGRPTLTQTSFTRWRYGSELQELNCPKCTQTPSTPLDYCNSTSTATN